MQHRMTARLPPTADPQTAGLALLKSFGPAAASEALFRAFLAEHDCDSPGARFWIEAYRVIAEAA